MSTIREIRKKLHAVGNIKKITQAMEMVAASRLRKAQSQAEKARPYSRRLKEILYNTIEATDDVRHPLIGLRDVKRTAIVAIAGDRGLCGSYNYNVISQVEKLLNNYTKENVELILIGRKIIEHFSGRNWKISDTMEDWGGKFSYDQVFSFTNKIIERYVSSEIDEVLLVFTHYLNIASRRVTTESFLPILPESKEGGKGDFLIEPNISEVLAEIFPRYSSTKMQLAMNESYASELSARIFSMRAASKNAEEMIERLTLVRNKVRQSGITRELIEITAGAQVFN